MIARYVTHIYDELELNKVHIYEYMYCLSQIMWNTSRISKRV